MAQNSHKANHSNEINNQKLALAKYLANAKFGYYDFSPGPKVALGEDPLFHYINVNGLL